MSNNKKTNKYFFLVTYCLALVCLLLGLFLPFFNGSGKLFMMLPDAFGKAFGIDLNLGGAWEEFTRPAPITFVGTQHVIDISALAIVLYAAVTVIGIIMLIPICVSKREKKTAGALASFMEAFAALFLLIFTLAEIWLYITTKPATFNWDYTVIGIAFGGVLLMMIIQAFGSKKGSGFLKFVVMLLSAAGVLALFDIVALFGIQNASLFEGKLYISFFGTADGMNAIGMVLSGGLDASAILFGVDGVKGTITLIAVACAIMLALVNFFFDISALGLNTKKGHLVVDIIRYSLQIIALVLAIVMLFVNGVDGIKPGLLMYCLLAISVILLIISSIRCAVYHPATSKATNAEIPSAYYDDSPIAEPAPELPAYAAPAQPAAAQQPVPQPQYVQPVYLQPVYAAPAPQAMPAPQAPYTNVAGSSDGVVYTAKEIYRGPTDAFISRLTDSEKIEFSKTFLEKINGSFANVPDYVIGGDNKDFFSSIFIYLGKFRPMLSDGLMNKFYNELNLLN